MKKYRLHPLDLWLLDKEQSLPAFSRATGIALRPLYEHINGEVRNPGVIIMLGIEKATRGIVSVQAQADWWKARMK